MPGKTFEYEAGLPKLPVPQLEETMNSIRKSLEPLYYADGSYEYPLEPDKIEGLAKSVETFLSSSAATKLQDKLKEFYASDNCYLDKLHLDINNSEATKELQDDVLPRNPFLVLAEDSNPEILQTSRAAILVNSACRFISSLKLGFLKPDIDTKTGKPLSMEPYLNLFGTTRCPVFQRDETEKFDLNKPYSLSDLDEFDESEQFSVSDDVFSESDERCMSTMDNDDTRINKDTGATRTKTSSKLRTDSFTRHGITVARFPEAKHILIIFKGQYYTLDVLDDTNKPIYPSADLEMLFDHIIDPKNNTNRQDSTALGSLTSHSYRSWKYARKRLIKRYPNELHLIDSALFVLILDDSDDNELNQDDSDKNDGSLTCNSSEDCKRLFYGTSTIDKYGYQRGSCISRWYDKLQLVVTADAKAAVIWDSFTCDGSVVLRFISETYTESILRVAREINGGDPRFSLWPELPSTTTTKNTSTEVDPSLVLHKIMWSFSDILNTHVHLSETKLADLISKHDIVSASLPFGKKAAQRLGVSPDSMIQIAIQIAQYALYGETKSTFEPVNTRYYKNSRSSFINIQSKDLLELCQLFISATIDGSDKLQKFIECCEKHHELVKKVKSGYAYEKHFNALRNLYKYHSHFGVALSHEDKITLSDVFDSVYYKPFHDPELIVANCGNSATTIFGITPAVPHGFGIGYVIKDDHCNLTVTSQFRQGKRLVFMINWVLNEIRMHWKAMRGASRTQNGVKISPLIDRLYELDNALRTNKTSRSSSRIGIDSYYGIMHHDANLEGRVPSKTSSMKNIAAKNTGVSSVSLGGSRGQSKAELFIPSETEKLNTGHQILQIQSLIDEGIEDDSEDLMSPGTDLKKNNVVNTKFDINFDRGKVGRKISTFE